MPGTHKSAIELERAVILRQGGYSLASIVEKIGISASTLSRHFKRLSVSKGGLTEEAVALASEQLISDAGFIGDLKREIAAAIVDDVAHVKQLREASALLLEQMMGDKSLPPHYKTRGLAALSTSLRLTQEVARKALRVDEMPVEQGELPELVVYEMSAEEVEAMRREQQKDCVFDVPDMEVIEIVDEGD